MPRMQVGDLPSPEGLQVTVSPNVATANAAPGPRLEDNPAYRLSHALGVLQPSIEKSLEDQTKSEAEAFFNSRTVGEISKAMKDGTLLPQNNPLFTATVKNLYGQNVMQANMRDAETKISSGELQFKTTGELESYLVEQRNNLLGEYPDNEYIRAGYDKNWNAYKNQILNTYSNKAAKNLVDNAEAQVTDALYNRTQSILNPNNKLSPQESISQWMSTYNVLKSTVLLDPKARKNALYDNATSLAAAGRPDLIQELLDFQTDNGLTVRGIIGNKESEYLYKVAENAFESQQRDFQKQQITAIQQQKAEEISREVSTKLLAGQGGFIPNEFTTISDSGELRTEKTDNIVKSELAKQTESLPLPQQIDRYARNGVVNDNWSTMINSGVTNLYTVGTSYDGKTVGELSAAGSEAFGLFQELNKISPEYARKVVKGDRDFEILQTMDDAINLGWAADANQAATLLNEQGRLNITAADFASYKNQIALAVEDYTSGWFSDSDRNTSALNSRVRKIAEIALKSGRSPNAQEAVASAMEHVKATSIEFNNAVYSRDQLPLFPQGDPADFWMKEFAKNKIDPVLKDNFGNRVEYSDFFLAPNADGTGFTLTMKDSPAPVLNKQGMPITFSKDEMVGYAREQYAGGQAEAALKQSYNFFASRFRAQYYNDRANPAKQKGLAPYPQTPTFEQYKALRGKTVEVPGMGNIPVQTLPHDKLLKWMESNGNN